MLKDLNETIYIAGQGVNTQIEPSAFCWRPHWLCRFESLWSLLRKFAYLNAINHYEIRKLFRCAGVSKKLDWKWYLPKDDLSHFGALDPSKLSIMFGIGDKDLAEATMLPYVHGYEVGILTSDTLRFCPTCIYQGFHSPLHQLLFLTNCPAHGERLEIRCTECSTLTIPYKLPSVSSKDLSGCAHMIYGLSQHLTYGNMDNLRKEAAKREKALLSVAKLLMKRVELNTPEQPITQWVQQGASRRYLMRHLKRLPAYWGEVFGSSSRGPFHVSKVADTHIQVSCRETSRTSEMGRKVNLAVSFSAQADKAWDLELYRIYKAIGRHLIRRYLSIHRRCIVRGGRRILWDEGYLTMKGIMCPASNALLLWRMCWEDIDHPAKLFRRRRTRREAPRPHIYWDSPSADLSDWALRRIFALECVGIFHECILLAEALYRRNAYSFHPEYVKGRRIPHWLIEKSERGKFTIHWWVSRSLSSFFSQRSPHFKSCDAKTMSD